MPRRILQGTVVSDKADKTITVQVVRSYRHPLLHKIMRRSKKFMAHDETNSAKMGDNVRIRECRPISKQKKWELLSDDAVSAKTE